MSLQEFLRKSNNQGEIINWIKKAYEKTDKTVSLNEFARDYKTYGEKVVAVEKFSMYNDKFYGQWLAMNKPFKQMEELIVRRIHEHVPEQHVHLACALELAPEIWKDERKIREHMELWAYKDSHEPTTTSSTAWWPQF